MSLEAAIAYLTELHNNGYKGAITYNFSGTGIADAEFKQRVSGEKGRLVTVS